MPQPPHGIASGAGPPLTSSTGGVLGHDAMHTAATATAAIASLTSTSEVDAAASSITNIFSAQALAAKAFDLSWPSYANYCQVLGTEIRALVHNVKSLTYRAAKSELQMLCQLYGPEVRSLALRSVLELVPCPGKHQNVVDILHKQLFMEELTTLSSLPQCLSLLLLALQDRPIGEAGAEKETLSSLSSSLDLPNHLKLIVGLACSQSPNTAISVEGVSFLLDILKSLVEKSTEPQTAMKALPIHIIHQLMIFCQSRSITRDDPYFLGLQFLLKYSEGQESIPTIALRGVLDIDDSKFGDCVWGFENEVEDGARLRAILADARNLHAVSPPALVMKELGYDCTESVNNLLQVFRGYPLPHALGEAEVAQMLAMMCCTYTGLTANQPLRDYSMTEWNSNAPTPSAASGEPSLTSWNVMTVVDAVRELNPSIKWRAVVRKLDQPDFLISDPLSLQVLVQCYRLACKDAFPVEVLLFEWKNRAGQISLLKALADAGPQIQAQLSFAATRQVNMQENLHPQRAKPVGTMPTNPCWLSLDFVETLLDLGSCGEHYQEVWEMFDGPIKFYPEVLALVLGQSRPRCSTMHRDLSSVLMSQFLSNHNNVNSSFVLHRLWYSDVGKQMIFQGLIQMYEQDPASVSRALSIAQELKALTPILEALPYAFSIDLAALASRREYLNLEKWLSDRINDEREPFLRCCLAYIKEKTVAAQSQKPDAKQGAAPQLSQKTQDIFLNCLLSKTQYLPPDMQEELKSLKFGSGFKPDIEEQANAIFQGIYTGKTTIAEAVNLLSRFKQSQDQQEQNIFACMVHNLFDEYRFFPKYPDKELRITGILFGSLIQHQLVTHLPLGLALRYVLEALRKPPDSKMFKFGMCALGHFQSRLREWPHYCRCILAIPHMRDCEPDMVKFVEAQWARSADSSVAAPPSIMTTAADASLPPPLNQSQGPSVEMRPPVLTADDKMILRGPIPIDTLLKAHTTVKVMSPEQETQDKVHFLFNNLSQANMDIKIKELDNMMMPEYMRWLGRYIVVKRVSIEPNFHGVYLEFLDRYNRSTLHNAVLEFTYTNVKALLKRDKVASNQSERTLLKNLGVWLGNITIARNKPVLHKFLDLRALITDAYERGRLIGVVPFVAKILDNAAKSKVFAPPQVWTMTLMHLLAEVYQIPRLKMNLKFEIELLCNNLGLDIEEIKPSRMLSQRVVRKGHNPDLHGYAGRTDASTGSSATEPSLSVSQDEVADTENPPRASKPEQPASQPYISHIASYVQVNPMISLFEQHPNLKKLPAVSIDRAIREIVAPVVERSVTIACITTIELVSKDFSMEPDETKMQKSAHLMVQTLAGSLALVTCKEPLRVSICNHLTTLIQSALSEIQPAPAQGMVEQAVQQVCADNLELACKLIEKASMEKAVLDTDEALAASFNARKKHRQQMPNQPFFDVHHFSGRYPAALSELLRPKPGGLTGHQLRVYEDFSSVPRHVAVAAAPSPAGVVGPGNNLMLNGKEIGGGAMATENADANLFLPAAGASQVRTSALASTILSSIEQTTPPSVNGQISVPQILDEMKAGLGEAANGLKQLKPCDAQTLQAVSADHPVAAGLRRALGPIRLLGNNPPAACTQTVFVALVTSESAVLGGLYISFLEVVASLVPRIRKDLTALVASADDGSSQRVNIEVIKNLLKARLLDQDYDLHLAQMLERFAVSPKDKAGSWVPSFLESALLQDNVAQVSAFPLALEAMRRLARQRKSTELSQIVDSLQARCDEERKAEAGPAGLRSTVTALFDEWMRISAESGNQSKAAFIGKLQQQGVLKGDELPAKFFAICTEIAVEGCLANDSGDRSEGEINLSFQAVDAFAKLVVLLVKYYFSDGAPTAKVSLFTTVLGVVSRVLYQDFFKKRAGFNQRPYYRMFTVWLHDLLQPDPALDSINWQILVAFSNMLMMLNPTRVPAFAFGWLELVSHKMMMPKLLLSKQQKGWQFFKTILVELLKFLEPFLRNAELSEPIRLLYKGTLRVLLVLLHDFPEFLCDYHFAFCDVIPPSCIQMRNLILSAFPRNMRLPDPFTPNLKVDLLPEINQPPRILSNFTAALQARGLLQDLDSYLKTRQPVSFLMDLPGQLMLPAQQAAICGTQYDVPVLNALVLYVGSHAITTLQSKSSQLTSPITHSAPMDIFQHLTLHLYPEGRYLFLNAIANQLRYPNNHTHYFSCVLLYLFAEASQEVIQEQITRVLLERLIVNRPHPWGLLITFIELIKNPRYSFWSHGFTRCAPEVERLFESVARSCILPSKGEEQQQQPVQ